MEQERNEKAAFMAQYWGQKVLRHKTWRDDVETIPVQFEIAVDSHILTLCAISAITDEDAIAVLKICGIDTELEQYKDFYEMLKEQSNFMEYLLKCRPLYFAEVIKAYQYLISRGYAVDDIYGTVEQKIEIGWIKLINK